jgi:hypothetical protein
MIPNGKSYFNDMTCIFYVFAANFDPKAKNLNIISFIHNLFLDYVGSSG